jgi:excisionase family DNA binding protein
MQYQATTVTEDQPALVPEVDRTRWRHACRDLTLKCALQKRAAGVPTYSVPEAAALMSVSQEHLYRLIRADAFPSVRMRRGGEHGRYVVPARAVEEILNAAIAAGGRIEADAFVSGGGQ